MKKVFKVIKTVTDGERIKNARGHNGFDIPELNNEKVSFGTFFQRGENPLDLMVEVIPENSDPFIMLVGNINGRKVVKKGSGFTIGSRDATISTDTKTKKAELVYGQAKPENIEEEFEEE